ncbi:hypothetical protein [Marinoscillum furvescens]|nr:hypothetical protein [Marinoscillum furvescens]
MLNQLQTDPNSADECLPDADESFSYADGWLPEAVGSFSRADE